MDAGIIKNVKVHHKGINLAKHNILEIDEKGSFDCLNLKQAIYFVKDSWNAVISNTITNCFCHVKIIPTVNSAHLVEVTVEQHLQADIDRMNLQSPLSAAEFLDVDATEETESPLIEDDILQLGQVDEHVDSLDQLDTTHPPQVALREGIHHAHLFLAPLEQHEAFGEEVRSMLLSEKSWTVCTQHLCPPPFKQRSLTFSNQLMTGLRGSRG